jgi:hypothetical protein
LNFENPTFGSHIQAVQTSPWQKLRPLRKRVGLFRDIKLWLNCFAKEVSAQSIHSRAAKRATSPSIDTDRSLKNVKLPTESSNYRPSVLAVHKGAGVVKTSKNGRKSVLSSKARRRQEKAMDRAEAVMDRTEKKAEKSKGRARTIQGRSKTWDELNRKMLAKKAREDAIDLEKNWVDEHDDDDNQQPDSAVADDLRDLDIEDALPAEDPGTSTNNQALEEEEIL